MSTMLQNSLSSSPLMMHTTDDEDAQVETASDTDVDIDIFINGESPTLFDMEKYLERCLDVIDETYEMSINESHRKCMIATVMGLSKQELDQKVRDQKLRIFWERTEDFFSKYHQQLIPSDIDKANVDNFCVHSCRVDLKLAPYYKVGLEKMETFQLAPQKLFSYLARGRYYQGKFDRLLEDCSPELVSYYRDEVLRDATEHEVFQRIADEIRSCSDSSAEQEIDADLLQRCVDCKFMRDPVIQPEDGGNRKGKQGELDLATFLSQFHQEQNNGEAKQEENLLRNIDRLSIGNRRVILSNVLAKSLSLYKKTIGTIERKNHGRKHGNLLFSKALENQHGVTSEFDAMVIYPQIQANNKHRQDNLDLQPTTIRIVEVWEAKATLNPVTLQDILLKKVPSVLKILGDSETSLLCVDGFDVLPKDPCSIVKDKKGEHIATSFQLWPGHHQDGIVPKIGIFSTQVLQPRIAARRLQVALCEHRLTTDRNAVAAALENGAVRAPDIRPWLEKLLVKVQELNPIVIVSSSPNAQTL